MFRTSKIITHKNSILKKTKIITEQFKLHFKVMISRFPRDYQAIRNRS